MADFASCSTATLLQDADTLFAGLRDAPDLLKDLADYQIEADDEVAAGLALIEDLRSAIGDQDAEAGQANAATARAAAAVAALRTGFVRHRKLARTAHPRGTAGHSALHLSGDTPAAEDAVLGDADAFYAALSADPTLADDVRGLDKAAIIAGLTRAAAARTAQSAQASASGGAQEATVRRAAAEASLRVLAQDVAAAAEDAFYDQPQRRERLGLFQRGSSRR